MEFESDNWYHIYNRGINRQRIFFNKANYLFFLKKLKRCFQNKASVIAYCLMPNHFHLLINTHANAKEGTRIVRNPTLNQRIGTMLSSYSYAVNKQQGRTGSLFQAETKSKKLWSEDDKQDYALICFHYIHQNPLRADLVSDLHDWPYSSYPDYAGSRAGGLPKTSKGYQLFDFKNPAQFRKASEQAIADHHVKKLF